MSQSERSMHNVKRRAKKVLCRRLIFILAFFLLFFQMIPNAFGDKAVVVLKKSGCDYFIANGPNGYYLLEWYGGYDPDKGDTIIGALNSYGFKEVYYPRRGREGRIYVEDYPLLWEDALEQYFKHCD